MGYGYTCLGSVSVRKSLALSVFMNVVFRIGSQKEGLFARDVTDEWSLTLSSQCLTQKACPRCRCLYDALVRFCNCPLAYFLGPVFCFVVPRSVLVLNINTQESGDGSDGPGAQGKGGSDKEDHGSVLYRMRKESTAGTRPTTPHLATSLLSG